LNFQLIINQNADVCQVSDFHLVTFSGFTGVKKNIMLKCWQFWYTWLTFRFPPVIAIWHVAFWVGQRTIDKKYPKELDKGNFIIIVVIFALIIQNVLRFIIYLIQFTCLEGLCNMSQIQSNLSVGIILQ
jgi:hypothetical protein